VHFRGFAAGERRVRPAVVVELEVCRQPRLADGNGVVSKKVDLLVFDTAPQALDEHVVQAPTFAVHRDPDRTIEQDLRELRRGELAPLVGVENLRLAVEPECGSEGRDAEIDIHGVGQRPGQHHPTAPVDHGAQIGEPPTMETYVISMLQT